MNPSIVNLNYGSELFNLTGDSGIVILPNNVLKRNSISMTKDDIDKLTNSDTLFMRWRLMFLPTNGSATIRDTDYISINASMHVEGVQNMDSLLHAGK